MHHASITRNNGTSITQVLLLVLLQVVVINGRILYEHATEGMPLLPHPLNSLRPAQLPYLPQRLYPLRPAQKDKKKTGPIVPFNVTPHLQDLGFFPRGNVEENLDDIRHKLPEIMNQTRLKEAISDHIWHDLMAKNSNHRQGDNESSLQNNSSQLGIPHLLSLGFGVANHPPVHGNNNDDIGVSGRSQVRIQYVHKMIILGVSSFLGGMLVILVLLLVIFIRRRRAQQRRLKRDIESEHDDPKLSLLQNEQLPAEDSFATEITNELSTSSFASTYSSTSSAGCVESSSQTSDSSHSGDLWQHPDHIALTALCQGTPPLVTRAAISPRTSFSHDEGSSSGRSPSLPPSPIISEEDSSHLIFNHVGLQESGHQNYTDIHYERRRSSVVPQSPIVFTASSSPFLFSNPSFENRTSNPPSPFIGRRTSESLSYLSSSPQQTIICNVDLPDLLLQSKPKPLRKVSPCIPKTQKNSNESSRKVSEDGGILSCSGGDVIVIIPPGALQTEQLVQLQIKNESTTLIKGATNELVVSPVIQVTCEDTKFFQKPITIKLPFRGLSPCVNRYCQCQDDPLCGCRSCSLDLKYWDTTTSSWVASAYDTGHYGVVNHYTWPECFSPEPGYPDPYECRPKAHVTYNCFKNMCTVQTNILGTFCMTSQPSEPRVSSLDFNKSCNQLQASVRLCAAIGAEFSPEHNTSSETLQIDYTVYFCDNTSAGRKAIEDAIWLCGRQQCPCTPLDVPLGSGVKVTVESNKDPCSLLSVEPTTKIIPWKELCGDYGTQVKINFRCSAKLTDVVKIDDVMTTFHVDVEEYQDGDHVTTMPVTLIAAGAFSRTSSI